GRQGGTDRWRRSPEKSACVTQAQPPQVKRYRFHREALDEYMAAREWYAERSEVALAFVDSIERAIRKTRRMPRAAARVPHETRQEIRRHVLRRFPYMIV